MDSILNTIKKMLGIDPSDDSYDTDIIININSVIPILSQMGIGPSNGFIVDSATQLWKQYIGDSLINLEGVKTYIYLKTKLVFDPPTNSIAVDSINNVLKELEWRMMLAVETNNLEV